MTIATPTLLSNTSDNNTSGAATTSATFTPTIGALLFVAHGMQRDGTSTPASIAFSAGTWSMTKSPEQTNSFQEGNVWRGTVPSDRGTAMTITVTAQGVTSTFRHVLLIAEITGANAASVLQAPTPVNPFSTSGGVTLSACSAGSGVFGIALPQNNTVITPGANYTELGQNVVLTNYSGQMQYDVDATGVTTCDWTDLDGAVSYLYAFEIAAPPPARSLLGAYPMLGSRSI